MRSLVSVRTALLFVGIIVVGVLLASTSARSQENEAEGLLPESSAELPGIRCRIARASFPVSCRRRTAF